jgi:pimeloyl-ACP methyl ester carboxylesterase
MLQASEGHVRGAYDALTGARLSEALGEVDVPILIVAGDRDPLLRPNLADFGRLRRGALHVFSRAGHQVPSDATEGLATAIADFMEHGAA